MKHIIAAPNTGNCTARFQDDWVTVLVMGASGILGEIKEFSIWNKLEREKNKEDGFDCTFQVSLFNLDCYRRAEIEKNDDQKNVKRE